MNCPKCSAAMETLSYAGIDFNRCRRCLGLWFDALKADRLKDIRGSESIDRLTPIHRQPPTTNGPVLCPRCHTQVIRMVVRGQPHIEYESCTVCFGSFFDSGEFADMKDFSIGERIASLVPGLRFRN